MELLKANAIYRHPLFTEHYALLQQQEQGRKFCTHTLAHFLDVARGTWILCQEAGLPVTPEVVYGAALLHDLGKGQQYAFGTPHQEAGVRLAEAILPDCGYSPAEISEITEAIAVHRKGIAEMSLGRCLYLADKKTRLCFLCPAAEECNWPEEKKNHEITV